MLFGAVAASPVALLLGQDLELLTLRTFQAVYFLRKVYSKGHLMFNIQPTDVTDFSRRYLGFLMSTSMSLLLHQDYPKAHGFHLKIWRDIKIV